VAQKIAFLPTTNNIIRKVTYNIHIFVVSGNRTRPNLYGFAYPKISSAVVVNVS
jgi:hypothetical protein